MKIVFYGMYRYHWVPQCNPSYHKYLPLVDIEQKLPTYLIRVASIRRTRCIKYQSPHVVLDAVSMQ